MSPRGWGAGSTRSESSECGSANISGTLEGGAESTAVGAEMAPSQSTGTKVEGLELSAAEHRTAEIPGHHLSLGTRLFLGSQLCADSLSQFLDAL